MEPIKCDYCGKEKVNDDENEWIVIGGEKILSTKGKVINLCSTKCLKLFLG